ncbi:hypothetical protein [Parasitella parasitica]|uniref:Uncharacterized protein n=1 Tax=Parasitella parasitica TaxID=35722 RepID=A0A0B7MUR2_9FUNG|nr:hypothetical protein [Parasitella parasitica]
MNTSNPQDMYLESPTSKPNSRSSSVFMMDTNEDAATAESKRRRLISSSPSSSPPSSSSSSLNEQQPSRNQQLTANLTAATTSSATDQQQPPSMETLYIGEKTRHELFSEQMRLREEKKRRKSQESSMQQTRFAQYFQFKPPSFQESKRSIARQVANPTSAQPKPNTSRSAFNANTQHADRPNPPPQVGYTGTSLSLQQQTLALPPQQQQKKFEPLHAQHHQPPSSNNMHSAPLPPAPLSEYTNHSPIITLPRPTMPPPLSHQQPKPQPPSSASIKETIVIEDDDDKEQVEQGATKEQISQNICIGMIITDIVVEKPPLILPKDDNYEIVSLESEGKLNTENYSFKLTSRSVPAKFYGWVPFKDTRVLGPLVDHRLIWWDSIIPRGKANNARTPLYIILYCRPDLYSVITKYFESQKLYLKTPPFYNPACRYSNPHAHVPEAQQQYLHQQQSFINTNTAFGYGNTAYTGYRGYNPTRPSEQEIIRQSQKDIESLLSSIPSDVPIVNRLKRKKKKKVEKKTVTPKKNRAKNFRSDDEVFQKPLVSMISDDSDDQEKDEETEEEEEEDGYEIEGLSINLMDHQIKGVSWMIDREKNQSSNGGILADDMGLGKTVQTIGLILSSLGLDDKQEEEAQEKTDARDKQERQMTLIVTPLALIHQWVDEIKNKTEHGKLRVLKHHGPNRTKNPETFKRFDVVVTTYQVVSSDAPGDKKKKASRKKNTALGDFIVHDEYDSDSEGVDRSIPSRWQPLKKGYGPLFQVKWHRIVLDEAQQIKNRQTKSSTSCSELYSTKRWCLTGTPIQNNVDELYSLLRFLKIQPLSDYATFKKNISIPIQNGMGNIAMERLKAVLRAVMLRRTKDILRSSQTSPVPSNASSPKPTASNNSDEDEPLSKKLSLQLPSREKKDVMLQFSDHEKSLYELLRTRTRASIQAMDGQSGRYMNMLCLLLRLRQACDHPQLILSAIDNDKDVLDIVTDDCRKTIISGAPNGLFKTSTKILKMIDILQQTRENNPGEKTIIFSQFTSMLDLMEQPLKKHGFKFCRYDGSMSSILREKSLERLKYDRHCTVMLISLKCGSLGLNLTSANRVILMDIWWNPALEEQAIDRVHRIGQRLPVHVTRLLIDNSVELKIMALQEKKALLTKGALDHGLVRNTKLTASEIQSLFDL